MKEKIKFLYIDIMRDYIWKFYHKWVLHRGSFKGYSWLAPCKHSNPYYILTPRLLKRQFKSAWEVGNKETK